MARTPTALTCLLLGNACYITITPACNRKDKGDSMADAPWVDVGAGEFLSCGVDGSGALACWGHDGMVGDTGPSWVDYGDAAPPEGRYKSIALSPGESEGGSWHACALADSGEIACWGRDDQGQASPPGGVFTQLALSSLATCALDEAGTISCWGFGNNVDGRPTTTGFQDLVGGNGSLCALDSDGTVTCWAAPTAVAQLGGSWTGVAVYNHVCVTAPESPIRCWQLYTLAEVTNSDLPTDTGYDRVCMGYGSNGCALTADGALTCWGSEYLSTNDEMVAYRTAMTETYQKVSCGHFHACGLTTSGEIRCWGSCKRGECTVPP